jgi:hypothetical protein
MHGILKKIDIKGELGMKKWLILICIFSFCLCVGWNLVNRISVDELMIGPGKIDSEANDLKISSEFKPFYSSSARIVYIDKLLKKWEFQRMNHRFTKQTDSDIVLYDQVSLKSMDHQKVKSTNIFAMLDATLLGKDEEAEYRKSILAAIYPYVGDINATNLFIDHRFAGSSDGLMKSLQIIQSVSHQDLTKGRKIAGTGVIDKEGRVIKIGSLDKKIIAAYLADVEIFLVPETQFTQAEKTKNNIHANFTLVPVKTIKDALDYLKKEDR